MALPALVEPAGELSRDEIFRYSRHLIIPDVAMDGQKRLKNARVLLIGAGGLGSPNAMYLAAAGVGHIGLVDFDEVDASNLQRQVIHGTSDIGRPKLESAADKIRELDPGVEVTLHETRLTSDNAREIIRPYDLVVDGSDNFPTRYLVNDACVLEGKPNVWGSIYRFDGQASVFWAEHGACYRCLYPHPPPPGMVPSCAEGGVLGVLCATVGSVQANEAIKLITGIGDPLVGRLLIYDALELSFKDIRVRKDPECPVCGKNPTVTELIDYEEFCGVVSDEPPDRAAADRSGGRLLQDRRALGRGAGAAEAVRLLHRQAPRRRYRRLREDGRPEHGRVLIPAEYPRHRRRARERSPGPIGCTSSWTSFEYSLDPSNGSLPGLQAVPDGVPRSRMPNGRFGRDAGESSSASQVGSPRQDAAVPRRYEACDA